MLNKYVRSALFIKVIPCVTRNVEWSAYTIIFTPLKGYDCRLPELFTTIDELSVIIVRNMNKYVILLLFLVFTVCYQDYRAPSEVVWYLSYVDSKEALKNGPDLSFRVKVYKGFSSSLG